MARRFAALALLALSSTTFAQVFQTVDDDSSNYLIPQGIADCIDAMIAINEESTDTTTIGTGPTRIIEGYVAPPTGTDSVSGEQTLFYTATVARETTSVITTVVIPSICNFQFACSSLENQNFSCTYDLILTTPAAFNANESFFAVATDDDDLATTWPGAGTFLSTTSQANCRFWQWHQFRASIDLVSSINIVLHQPNP